MSNSDDRLSSPDKSNSSCSPSDLYVSSEKDDESRSTLNHANDLDPKGGIDKDIAADLNEKVPDEDDLERHDDEYFRPIKKLRMVDAGQERVPSPSKPLTSFLIKDILSHKPNASRRLSVSSDRTIVRPWALGSPANLTATSRRPRSADDDSQSDKSESDLSTSPAGVAHNSSPLDALFEMTSKAFEGLDADEKSSDPQRDHLNLFSNRQQPKKKRKSRTAFTNHQIFELEKRFLYQKYLSPADRDEIAQSLGLTNAQVITWFQNRRAKLKRDMEELKKDVDAAKVTGHRTLLDSLQETMNNVSKQNVNKSTDL